jgi:hypothetical protein
MNKYTADVLQHAQEIRQQSEAWNKVRLGKFTASTVHHLMNDPRSKADKEAGRLSQSADKYVIQKAMEVITGESQEDAYGRAIDWGNEWEEHALNELHKRLEFESRGEVRMVKKPSFKLFNEYSGCSADAIIYDREMDPLLIVEMKCPYNSVTHFMHSRVTGGLSLMDINEDYYWQVQMNMLVHQTTAGYFASYDPRQPEHRRLHYARIEADISALQILCERLERAEAIKQRYIQEWTASVQNAWSNRDGLNL